MKTKKKAKEMKMVYEYIEPKTDEEKAEAQRSIDAAFDVLFDAMWDKHRTVKIPKRLKEWYGRVVYLLAAPDHAIQICDEPTHEDLVRKAAAVLRADGVKEDETYTLDKFFSGSTVKAEITSDGKLVLPEVLLSRSALLQNAGRGRWVCETIPTGISIRRSG